uniref:Uncharacterized protein n=1 Tax=Rhizophagus irregularis (strain DAOM 181602 / DAOM 197198 / MUCL 43194) TaxID=747089 RepID=U9UM31_RHIID
MMILEQPYNDKCPCICNKILLKMSSHYNKNFMETCQMILYFRFHRCKVPMDFVGISISENNDDINKNIVNYTDTDSDDEKLAYTVYEENNKCYPKIIDLNNNKTKDNKWFCKKIYLIPEDFEVINISKYVVNNKLYLFSKNSIFEWDFVENHGMRIFYISKEEFKSRDSESDSESDSKDLKNNIRISPIRIVSLDINDSDVQIIEDSNDHFDEHLNINIFNPHMGKIHDLFQKVSNSGKKYRNMLDHTDPHQDLLKRDIITDKLRWKIQICGLDKIVLNVYKKVNVNDSKWESTGYGETEFHILDTRKIKLLEIELLNDDDIIIITTIELFYPQTNPFVETTANKDIYDTWNALLGCFTAAATIPQQYIDDDVRKNLLVASIVIGFIHLIFEVRQFIYDPFKWILDFWNIFGK